MRLTNRLMNRSLLNRLERNECILTMMMPVMMMSGSFSLTMNSVYSLAPINKLMIYMRVEKSSESNESITSGIISCSHR